ncbi:hypothetical protein [Pseudonocardia alaniniphila]|uniref:Ribbon-helix-helix CopG family protein n=1 Tax=Pseudonocardia alaniniphila TaxID=75291 RepID=A0ABS9T8S8_9PSEU|nr:hypothetical protein [Pseudonocardia alaniniphila]MCH6164828.1 hypothetical protein [Pseudonocardia alaniniphila]
MAHEVERIEVEVDAATARWLRTCARTRGGSMAEAAARQLHELALADSVRQHAAWYAEHPTYIEDAEAERIASLSA